MVQHMQLEDWLDDLCVRFIINLPQEDLSSVARICFQVEEAQWFYEDFIRPLDPTLPSMTLRTFCLRIFQHCPLLASFSVENHTKAFEEFLQYKTRVPVRGAILLNHAMDSVVLVKGWKKGANWSFPRGKINKDEDDLDCAVREVYEETGLDLSAAGLVPTDKKPKYIEISMREQQLRLYVFRDVPMDTNFQPRTRKEISKIQWYKLSELPTFRKKNAPNNQNEPANAQHNNKFYMVAPFLVPLKKWVIAQKKLDEKRAASSHYGYLQAQMSVDETHTEDDAWGPGRDGSRSQVPAIDTLDGATRELQRLLKMQPPTQGVQPPLPEHAQQPLEDKGSALLSILQASGQRSEAHSQMSATQVTQMPLDHLSAQQSQPPPNAHHQHNPHIGHPNMYQQQPPPFQIPPSQQPPMGYGYPGMTQLPQHLQTNSAPLVHPQPHAPQVQAGVFNAESFQDSSQSRFPQPQQQHNQVPPNAARQGPLSGQSMALLNAFKRDTSHQPTMTNLQPPPPQQQQQLHQQSLLQHLQQPSQQQRQAPQQAQQTQHQQSLLQHLQQPSQEQPQHQAQQPQGPQPGRTPTELSGSSVPPPTNNHRNTLLDMFKKPGESPVQSGAAAYSPQQQQQHAQRQEQARQMEHALQQREIIGRQQREEVARQQREAAQRQQEHAQQQEQAHQMEQARQQRDVIARQQREEVSRQQREAAQRQQEQAQQQREYAQRQREQAEKQRLEAEQQRQHQPSIPLDKLSLQPQTSPQILPRGQPLPASFNGPSTSTPPADQKRQLLSLFGGNKPPASTSGSATVHEIAGTESPHAKSRVGSLASTAPGSQDPSRRGSETPMSPADESFLLGYLQSVTTNAKR